MIKIFDGHADIWNDVHDRREKKEENIFKNNHYERFKKGGVHGGIFVIYLPEKYNNGIKIPEEGLLPLFKDMLNSAEKEIESFDETIKIIKTKEDLKSFFVNDSINIVKGIEGLKAIRNEESIDLIDELYKLGYRVCSLAWNEENILATGTRGNKERGLTELGKKCISKMEKLGMVVDVSHLNEKSFWDVIEVAKNPIIASHSASSKEYKHARNLTDEQIIAVAKTGGVVGVNAYRNFLDNIEKNKTVERYVDHIEHIISVGGINSVGIGFDFCEYLPSEEEDLNLEGLRNASDSQNVVKVLRERGYSDSEIELIAHKNFKRVFEKIFK
ncbi:MAG: dipeptidase [Fusobacteriaceae bacterium]